MQGEILCFWFDLMDVVAMVYTVMKRLPTDIVELEANDDYNINLDDTTSQEATIAHLHEDFVMNTRIYDIKCRYVRNWLMKIWIVIHFI